MYIYAIGKSNLILFDLILFDKYFLYYFNVSVYFSCVTVTTFSVLNLVL